jgi:glutamate synthase (NADPH/NADH) small chain
MKDNAMLHPMSAHRQASLPGGYSRKTRIISLLAFGFAFFGWLNERQLHWFDNPVWLSHHTEYLIILGFGLWRIAAERNIYTKKRLIVLVSCVAVLWWLIPWALPFSEPFWGTFATPPTFPSLHAPGTVTFFLTLIAVLLFGRRVICGWNCPCVGIRETVGFPFRKDTVKSNVSWKFRHSKWLFFGLYVMAGMIIILSSPRGWKSAYLGGFYGVVALTYFGSFLVAPLVGNRFYCRYLCPYGATFGVLNRIGFFHIDYRADTCTECRLCTEVCDMGVPIVDLGKKHGKVNVADCMGCGRCITECPTQSLVFHDLRNVMRPAFQQNRERLKASADWKNSGTRLSALIFIVVMVFAIGLAGWLYSVKGTSFELPSNLKASSSLR